MLYYSLYLKDKPLLNNALHIGLVNSKNAEEKNSLLNMLYSGYANWII